MGRTAWVVVLLALLCAACDGTGKDQGDGNDIGSIDTGGGKKTEDAGGSSGTSVERVGVSTLATNLEVPWSFAFLPGGNALVTERDSGRLLRVNPSGEVREVQTLPEGGSGEGGLLGVAVSPNYEKDRYVYAYYTTERGQSRGKVSASARAEPVLTSSRSTRITTGVGSSSAGRHALHQNGRRRRYGGTPRTGALWREDPTDRTRRLYPQGQPFRRQPVYLRPPQRGGAGVGRGGAAIASEFGQKRGTRSTRIEAGRIRLAEVEGKGGQDRG